MHASFVYKNMQKNLINLKHFKPVLSPLSLSKIGNLLIFYNKPIVQKILPVCKLDALIWSDLAVCLIPIIMYMQTQVIVEESILSSLLAWLSQGENIQRIEYYNYVN